MQQRDEDEADVIAAIRAAFGGVRRGAITIHEAEVIDSWGGSAEREMARRLDIEEVWEQVPDEAIKECEWD